MKYTVNEKKDGKIVCEFALNAKEWEAEVENAYQKNKGKYKKEGFRQGKVPRKVLENTYGPYLFYEDAFNLAFPKLYSEMLSKEKSIFPVDYPEVDLKTMDENGITFNAIITVIPDVEIGKYTGLTIEKQKTEVSEKDITKEIDALRERNARYTEIKDRAVQKGDLVNLDYTGKIDGIAFDGGTAKDQELAIGSRSFIEGFEDQMIGMNIGEEKDINVTFPEKYHSPDLAGKPAVFTVKVLGIREKQLPKVDDEFAKDVSEFDSLAKMKEDLTKKMVEVKERNAEIDLENRLMELVSKNTKADIPKTMIEKQIDGIIDSFSQKLYMQGLSFEDYLKVTGTEIEAFRKSKEDEAKKMVKISLTLEEIIKREKIKITEKEITEKTEEIAKQIGQTGEDFRKRLTPPQTDNIKNNILSDKVIKFLKENNTIS